MARVREATRRGEWYRAYGNGERVTLASLWRRGAIERRVRARDGQTRVVPEGSADAAYEYQTKRTA
jgi:hypothetical protein